MEGMMHTDALLRVARDIIAKVPACMAITVDQNGDANARVVNPKPLSEAWTVRFATDRRSRKPAEIEQSGRLTLAYQYDAEKAYVALIGRAAIREDVAAKLANWDALANKWLIRTWSMSISSPSASSSGPHRKGLCQIRCVGFGRPFLSVRDRAGFSPRRFLDRSSWSDFVERAP
jgi:general stress protein 26